jgi:hypothetical protein
LATGTDSCGITLSLEYITETAWNIAGGIRIGADYADRIGIEADPTGFGTAQRTIAGVEVMLMLRKGQVSAVTPTDKCLQRVLITKLFGV